MDRVANVYYAGRLAGILVERSGEFQFRYDPQYLASGTPLSFNLPLQSESFVSRTLFPFFENLVSEGWLRKLQSRQQKVDESDRFGLLLLNGEDLVGAVTVTAADRVTETRS
ncbi:MAG: HipA N-terminal domain-containing protein [Pseudomonadota bacterium]